MTQPDFSLTGELSYRQAPPAIQYSEIAPLGLRARASKKKIAAQTGPGPYNDQNNLTRFIISSASHFMDPSMTYLKFDLKVTAANNGDGLFLDGSASSIIKSLRISSRSGGVDLEYINEYGNLYNSIANYTLDNSNTSSILRCSEGWGKLINSVKTKTILQAGALGDDVAALKLLHTAAAAPENVASYNEPDAAAGTGETSFCDGATSETVKFCVPIMSAVVGSMNHKYLPLFLCGDIVCEIQWTSNGLCGNTANSVRTNYEVKNPELHCQMIEFQGNINQSLAAVAKTSGVFIHSTSFRHYPKYIAADNAAKAESILVNERLKSVKSVLVTFNPVAADVRNRALSRKSCALTEFQIKYGSEFVPSQPIKGDATDISEFVTETMKALGNYGNVLNPGSVVNPKSWAVTTVAGGVKASCGRALYGIDTDAFSKQNLESGIDLNLNNPLYINVNGTFTEATNANVYLLHDLILSILPNGTFISSC